MSIAIEKELLLLNHQFELVSDLYTPILGMVSGYGGGKTYAGARKACVLAQANAGCDGIITEPNFPLLTQILIPEMQDALDFFEIPYSYSKGEGIFYCVIDNKETRIICKSLESYERLIGINAAWVIMDEFDTTKPAIAYKAYQKLLGRIRVGNTRQMNIISTPEGFGAMYKIFIQEAGENKRLIQAKTTDNKHLPKEYIDLLYDTYPTNLAQAYIEGKFVNLTSGNVYYEYDRRLNHTDDTVKDGDTLHIGMDFNVGEMCAVVHVIRDGKPRAVDEFAGLFDTPQMISAIKGRYRTKEKIAAGTANKIIVYPDASGGNKKTNNASTSDIAQLRQAGFTVLFNPANPQIKDRVAAMNNLIHKNGERVYLVNVDKCPTYVEALEKQGYKNGEPDKTTGLDHPNDAAGYFISYRYPIAHNKARLTDLKGT